MTILLYFTITQERRREVGGFFVCFGMKEKEGLYSSGGGNMNRMSFNES